MGGGVRVLDVRSVSQRSLVLFEFKQFLSKQLKLFESSLNGEETRG